ncbi:alpha/beta fold hydrolase [Streptomyces parvulus]|uniref:Alpha/beta hydrolase n=1 Tax=Streptomyces parvulus TaxID=146923 RepID=A0A369UYP2_9ACTN|nr:alpha/beta fold hydrolase [Streptomyces parvulus]RDD85884.1 alpha/beta hydrolase [Streptomyces parvulus]
MRPALLFVHGIGSSRDPKAERDSWLAALAIGARKAGHSSEGSALAENAFCDTAFAYYGDLFTSPQAQGAATPDATAGESEELRRLLEGMIDAQLAGDPDMGERRVLQHARVELMADQQTQGSGDLIRRLVNVCTTLLALPGMRRGGQWVSGRLMAGDLAQVTRYLSRAEADDAGSTLDECIRERMLSFLNGDRPTVIIAHSLGSIVALEALHQHRGAVPLLVTIGSPIGMRTVVLPRLQPQPPATPDCVERWLNYWDRDDIIAPRPWLDRDVLPNAGGCVPVSDRVDSDGIWAHTATKYLAQASVAGPIVEAIRLAGQRPSA